MTFNETTAMTATTMKSRRTSLLTLLFAAAFPLYTDGEVIPRPAAAAKQAEQSSRLVELPRNRNEHAEDGDISNIYNSNDEASYSSSSSLLMGEEDHLVVRSSQSSTERLVELSRNRLAEHANLDDILPSPPSFAFSDKLQRHLSTTIIDGTIHTSNALRQSLEHEKLSAAPSFPSVTASPSVSSAPTREIQHHYADFAEDEGLCPEDDELETTFEDGTGSHGALFDMLAKTNLTLTSVDLNMDWYTGSSAHVLIYARKGSWFGHQNNAEAWPHLIVNTTLYRPQEFHNRSEEGPCIPISAKKESAMIPKGAFKPLRMRMGETWSLYVCTSLADFRYTLGTSIGKTYASNSQLRVMEGAGAADYPPFLGDTPENGNYTFYAPRLFNGNLHYEYVADCPSASPSIFNFTLVPTPTPTLTTSVTYTFYIEHSPDTLKGAVTYDMRFGVREVLDGFLKEGGEDILRGLAVNHELVIDKVEANMVSPSDIGYLCYPTPPQTCTPISVNVTATHRATATIDDVTYAFLRQSLHLPGLINVKGYTIEYVGDRAVETNSEITISGVPDREMGETEQEFFASAARSFLEIQAKQGNNTLQILSVTVNGQMITTGESASGQEITTSESGQEITSSESEALQWTTIEQPSTSTSSSSSVMPKMNNSNRRLEKGSNNVKVKVKGKYRPPPEVDLGEFVEDSINSDRELLQKELKKPLALRDESDYFAKAEVVGAREIKEDEPSQKAPTMLGMVVMKDQQEDDSLKDMLNFAAMAVGGLIALLSAAFIFRPHRRRVMFGGKNADNRGHRNTQSVDFEDQNLLKKSRAMVRGWGSGSLTNSGTSGASPNDKKAYNLRGSTNSERMLAYSDFSHGQHQGFDPNSSLTSSNRPPFDPHASGTSQMSSANLGASFTRGGGGPNGRHDLSGSFIRGGGGPNGRHQPLNLSGTSGPPVSLQGSFTQGNPAPPPPHYGGGPGGPGPHEPPQPNPFSVPGGADGRPPHQPGRANGLNNSMPPRRHPPPPGGNHPSNSMPPNSMPPMRGGPPGPQRGPMNQSMPPQRGGMGGRRRSSQDSAPPRGLRRPSRDGPPPMRGSVRGSFRVDGHLGMSMPPNQQQQQRGPPVTGEGGQRQIHDSRRNQSMRPQHHHR